MKTTVTEERVIPTLQNMQQVYEKYTEEDHLVWEILFNRQIKNLDKHASSAYLKGLEVIEFKNNRIPNFQRINQVLGDLTGWELVAVEGIVNDQLFFELLADKKFPATTWVRKMSELDYLEEPDMFHDVFAHVPLLANQQFVDFLEKLAKIALKHIDNGWAIQLVSRIYWFTVEFGLIEENGELKIYGAGILSSAGETLFSVSKEPVHHDYDVERMFNTGYRKDHFQQEYFIIDSFDVLYNSIDAIGEALESRVI
jgi:phenylalanine-4-hydroxylase